MTKVIDMNHSTLTELFKSELGMTSMEYLWQYRITIISLGNNLELLSEKWRERCIINMQPVCKKN